MIGAVIGATIATHVPGNILKIVFGVVILAGGIRMLTATPPKVTGEPVQNPLPLLLWGIPLGIATGFVGIGGGVILVPVMTLFLRFTMHQAVGTSTAMMLFTCLGGLIGYIVNGWSVTGIPSPNLGYVHIWSWLALASASIIMARVGAGIAHKIPAKQLKQHILALNVRLSEWLVKLHLPVKDITMQCRLLVSRSRRRGCCAFRRLPLLIGTDKTSSRANRCAG